MVLDNEKKNTVEDIIEQRVIFKCILVSPCSLYPTLGLFETLFKQSQLKYVCITNVQDSSLTQK